MNSDLFLLHFTRCLEDILNISNSNPKIEIWASYLQIYCENITDLLSTMNNSDPVIDGTPIMNKEFSPLSIREKNDGSGVFVEGLSKFKISALNDLFELLARGDENRATAATNMNETSSRSHAILMLSVIIPETDSTGNVVYKEGQLVLVDLAGSERAKASEGRDFMRLEEAKSINLSLSALGNCMNALSEGRGHIPYRDSKLTRLLQNCLCGKSRTAIIVTIHPGEDSTGETLAALRFSSRASKVKIVAQVSQYRNYEAMYKETISKLRQLESLHSKDSMQSNTVLSLEEMKKKDEIIEHQTSEIESLKQKLQSIQRENELLQNSRINVMLSTPLSSVNEESKQKDSNSKENDENWREKITSLTSEHVKTIDNIHKSYQNKINEMRRSIDRLHQDKEDVQNSLHDEQEKHLQTVQQLRKIFDEKNSLENEDSSRRNELLTEINDKQNELEDLKSQFTKVLNDKQHLETLIQAKDEQMRQMVTKEQVTEMEMLFMDTINRLSQRVQMLEKKNSPGPSDAPSFRSDPTTINWMRSAVSNDTHHSSDRGVRIEPGGKIRPSNSFSDKLH